MVVRLRTSEDGVTWSSWYSSGLEVVNDASARRPQAFIEAVWTGAGRYVQVEARAAGGSAWRRRGEAWRRCLALCGSRLARGRRARGGFFNFYFFTEFSFFLLK